jgi:hypothetical protein
MATINLGVIASTTLQNYRKQLADNIFKENVAFNHMKANGGIEMKDGGRQLVVPLMYGVSSAVQAFDGADTLDLTYQDGIDAATYNWKNYNASVVITKTDELDNSGKSQIIDLLKAKIMQAENSLKERINNDFHNGAASDSKELTGIETAIGTGTYGGIAGGTYTWWQSYVESTSATLSLDYIRTGVNTVNLGKGGGKVSLHLTTQTLHQKYEALLTADINYNVGVSKEINRLGDAGFYALGFRGVPVVFDEATASGYYYFLNSKNLRIAVHKDANFAVVKKADPSDQHVKVQHILARMQTVIDRRASLGVLTGKTST